MTFFIVFVAFIIFWFYFLFGLGMAAASNHSFIQKHGTRVPFLYYLFVFLIWPGTLTFLIALALEAIADRNTEELQ